MSPLWLHVFGRGYGESLVLALPNGDWGVLDCYAPSVLCGDAESRNWEIILVDVGTANLTAAGIKIGHHGATSGYIDGLWPAFSAAGKPVAVLTTWYRGGKTLPQRAALEHLRPYVSRLFTTAPDLIPWLSPRPLQPVPSGTPTEATVVLLDQLFPSLGSQWGVCSLAFDNRGRCVETQCHGRAAELELNNR